MPATFPIPVVTPVDDDLITAALWNTEFENLYDNFNPAGIDDYSASDAEMQTETDPYPGGTVSRPTSLQGELERMRYLIKQITGKTYWYQDPSFSLENFFAAGTKLVFFQASAPTGWTQDTTHNGKALRVVSAAGGGSGGSSDPSSTITLAHTHTVASHTHDMGNHTHSTPAHQHNIEYSLNGGYDTISGANLPVLSADSAGASLVGALATAGANSSQRAFTNRTESSGGSTSGAPSTNTTGATSPSTDSQLSNISLAYINVIVCTKD